MGRSRRRTRRSGGGRPPVAAERALERLNAPRRILAAYLAAAVAVAVVALLGTVLLAGALAPWLVLAVVAGAGLLIGRWSTGRLAGTVLSDEDRLLQTMAGGLLVLAALLALVAAVVLTV